MARPFPTFHGSLEGRFEDLPPSAAKEASRQPLERISKIARRLAGNRDPGALYEPVRLLSSKQHSCVVLARRHADGHSCVIKRVRREFVSMLGAFSECEALSQLSHPLIPTYYDAGRDLNGDYWVESEYVEGDLLSTRLNSNRPVSSLDQSRELRDRLWAMKQLVSVIQYVHWNEWIHGDVNPANVVVSASTNRFALIDFEFASHAQELNTSFPRFHSLDYAAPEDLDGAPPSQASDLYALGKLGNQLLQTYEETHAELVAPCLQFCELLTSVDPKMRQAGMREHRDLWERTFKAAQSG